MLDRPASFVVINLAVYVPLLAIFGFGLAPAISIAMAVFIFAYNLRFVDIFSSLGLSIIYLLVFDSDAFIYTDFKFRVWYFPLIALLVYRFLGMKFRVNKTTMYFLVPIAVMFFFSLYYLFIETYTFKLHIVKYWAFSVALIYVLVVFFEKQMFNVTPLLKYAFSIIVFVALFGLIQYAFMLRGSFNLIRTARDVRPEAFFSETTWYAEYLVLGFVLIFLLIRVTGRKDYLLWLPVLLIGLATSVTRNAFLGLFIFIFFEIVYFFLKGRMRTRQKPSTFMAFFFFFLLGLLVVVKNSDKIIERVQIVANRFNLKQDRSSVGRMEAFEVSFRMMKETPLFGNGFYWNEEVKAGISNTAVGAKSFNLLFMIYHIFGPVGFLFFFSIIVFYFCLLIGAMARSFNIFSRYAFYVFTIFFVMAMFAPIHQFPIGMYFVAFSVFLYNCGLNGKDLLRHT